MTIEKLLNDIGIKVFIEYFQYFKNNNLHTDDLIEILPDSYTKKSKKSRTSKARRLIRENREQEALNYILKSKRISQELKDIATKTIH